MVVSAPTYLVGDLVKVNGAPTVKVPCMVVCVQPSDQVPDAEARGLANVYPWQYWVFDGSHVLGPMSSRWLARVE